MSTRIGDSGRDRQDDQDSENADGNADDYDVCVCVWHMAFNFHQHHQ